MNIVDWIPSISTTSVLAIAIWLGRRLIENRLKATVQHEFAHKLEEIKANLRENEEKFKASLREKEVEIGALRNGTLAGLSNRQMALDKRRLEAIDHIWAAVVQTNKYKVVIDIMKGINFSATAERAISDPKINNLFSTFDILLPNKSTDMTNAESARPYISQNAWALFQGYRSLIAFAYAQFTVIKTGVGSDILDFDRFKSLMKAILPHHADNIDSYGEAYCYMLSDEIENKLLYELQYIARGTAEDELGIKRAAEILKLSKDVQRSMDHHLTSNY